MDSRVNSSLETQSYFFPDYPSINHDIVKIVLIFLAKLSPLNKFMELASLNKAWKKLMTSDEVFLIIFDKYVRPNYSQYIKRLSPIKPNDVKNWVSNLNATCCDLRPSFQPEKSSLPVSKVSWYHSITDGRRWVISMSSDSRELRKSDITQLANQPVYIAKFTEQIKDIKVFGNTIAVMLTSGKLTLYNGSTDQMQVTSSYNMGQNVTRFCLMEEGFIYKNVDGFLFFQSSKDNLPIQLSETPYNAYEKENVTLGQGERIPLIASSEGYYLTISNQASEKDRRHFLQLCHLNHKDPVIILSFTTNPLWVIDMNDKYLVALHSDDGRLLIYHLAMDQDKIWSTQMIIGDIKSTHSLSPIVYVKIWGEYVVITYGFGKVRFIAINRALNKPPSIELERALRSEVTEILKPPFVSPNGLNFIVKMFSSSSPILNGSAFTIHLITWSFSPFPSALSQLPSDAPPRLTNLGSQKRKHEKTTGKENRSKK